ncbi:unnamed protein product [Rotaria sordida]|uniref:Uncharacterized protein n=1 Tax=Rotaria sordida TaxID=392033 RepID=A0A813ZVZ6_9BILA|nr:unnamed protein product [Rotaria sordida]
MSRSNKCGLIRDIPARRLPENRSGITLVWLENISCSSCDDNQVRLHSFSNRCFIVYYSSIPKCIRYLKQTQPREYVIAIIVSYPMETIQHIIHRFKQFGVIQTMFVIYSDRDADNHLSLIIDNVHIFQTQESMFELLEKRIEEIEERNLNDGLFTTFCQKEKSLKDVREDLATFVWTHTVKVQLMSMPHDSLEAKRHMLSECRAYYRNDAIKLAQIDKFERKYQSKDAIRWYTKPGFLFYLVNKALRSQDIWVLYKFRYFIIDLCHCLEQISSSQSFSSIRLYRGTKLNRDELEQLHIGCLISTNGFLSCSSDRNVAEMFIGIDLMIDRSSTHNRDAWQQFVLFIIDVDRRTSTNTVVADTKMLVDHQGYAQTLHTMGLVHRALGDDKKALIYLQQALQKQYSLLVKDHPYLASTYYQLSLIHNDRGESETALDYIQKALSIQLMKLPHHHSELKLSRELFRRLEQSQ